MEQHNHKDNLVIKIAISATLIALLVLSIGLASFAKKQYKTLAEQNKQISNLIDEVGQIKESREELSTQLNGLYADLGSINQNIDNIHSSAVNVDDVKSKLGTILNQKEQTISILAAENQIIKKQLTVPANFSDLKNILIIGQNQKLTDSMIIATVDEHKNRITLTSIPRDLYYQGRKINELYEYYGVSKLEEALSNITGLNIDKYVIFDFQSFVTLVDSVGGVDVNVEKALTDYQYPTSDKGYETVSFKAGIQHMDGSTALKYARSRHSTNDFDRSKRQHQIIEAAVAKAKSMDIINKLDVSLKIYQSIMDHTETDISFFEAMAYFNNYKNFSFQNTETITTANYLYSTISTGGQYILLPKVKDFSEIQAVIMNQIGK